MDSNKNVRFNRPRPTDSGKIGPIREKFNHTPEEMLQLKADYDQKKGKAKQLVLDELPRNSNGGSTSNVPKKNTVPAHVQDNFRLAKIAASDNVPNELQNSASEVNSDTIVSNSPNKDGLSPQKANSRLTRTKSHGIDYKNLEKNTEFSGKIEIIIRGVTHSVSKPGLGVQGAKGELKELPDGYTAILDQSFTIKSNRGPNQENLLNAKLDSVAEGESYKWHPIYSDNKNDYDRADWPYVREGTYAQRNVDMAPVGYDIDMRPRAAPTDKYEKIDKFNSVSEYISAQADYQNELATNYSWTSVMTSHRSVGMEYEFIGFVSTKSPPSHKEIGESKSLSTLFKLPFILETDAGSVIELVLPPFLIPSKEDGSVDKVEINKIHNALKEELVNVKKRCEGKTLSELKNELSKSLGISWNDTEKDVTEFEMYTTVHSENDGKKVRVSKKVLGDEMYSQMNISLNSIESAEVVYQNLHLTKNQQMLNLFNRLGDIAQKVGIGKQGDIITHINKSLVSALAIPALMARKIIGQEKTFTNDDEFDLHSSVKELGYTWIKDSPSNIIKTSSNSMIESELLSIFKKEAIPVVMKEIDELIDLLEEDDFSIISEVKSCKTAISVAEVFLDDDDQDVVDYDSKSVFLDDNLIGMLKLQKFLVDNDSEANYRANQNLLDDLLKLKTETPKKAPKELYKAQVDAISKLVTRSRQFTSNLKGDLATLKESFRSAAELEINTLFDNFSSNEMISSEKTEFLDEDFGSGAGVRKDTLIKPDVKTTGLSNRPHYYSVAELRGNGTLELYFKQN